MSWPDNTTNQGAVNQQAGGSFLDVIGNITKGVAGINSTKSRGAAEGYNAELAGQNAQMTGAESAQNVSNLRIFQQQQIGQQRANIAEAGTGGLSSGTNPGVINQSEVNANMQALTEEYRGNVQRTSLQAKQQLDQYGQKVEDQNATQEEWGTGLSATAQLLKGFGRYQNGLI